MKLFIDSANLEEVRKAASWGIIDGTTTNPSLIAKSGSDFKQTVLAIAGLIDGPVSAEVISTNLAGMADEATEYSKWHKNIVVKVPLTQEGIQTVAKLGKQVKFNATLCFSANQALLAAKAGATFVSPFIGRLDDAGGDGMQLVRDMRKIFDNYGFKAQILASSIRTPEHVMQAALAGAHAATCPFTVLKHMFAHPLTDAGLKKFLEDWRATRPQVP